jgi:hypothetical protein
MAPPPPLVIPSTPAPTQADVDALDVIDGASRDADRAKAVQYYNRVDADEAIRAQAAFKVAGAYNLDKRYAEAEVWVDKAIAMNALTAPGPSRTRRDDLYQRMRLNNARLMTADTTGP